MLDALGDSRKASPELFRQHFEVPIRKIYESLGYGHLSNEQIDKYNSLWQKEYKKFEHLQPLQPGMNEAFDFLYKQNIHSIILSNHLKAPIEQRLRGFQLDFDAVLANDNHAQMVNSGKKHRLEKFFEEENYNPENCLIIGDSLEEYEIARTFNMEPLIVTNGFYAEHRLETVPKRFRHTTQQLPKLLKELLS